MDAKVIITDFEGGNTTAYGAKVRLLTPIKKEYAAKLDRWHKRLEVLNQCQLDELVYNLFLARKSTISELDSILGSDSDDLIGNLGIIRREMASTSLRKTFATSVCYILNEFHKEKNFSETRVLGIDDIIYFAGTYGIVRDNGDSYDIMLKMASSGEYKGFFGTRPSHSIHTSILSAIGMESNRRKDKSVERLCLEAVEGDINSDHLGISFMILIGFDKQYLNKYFGKLVEHFQGNETRLFNIFYTIGGKRLGYRDELSQCVKEYAGNPQNQYVKEVKDAFARRVAIWQKETQAK